MSRDSDDAGVAFTGVATRDCAGQPQHAHTVPDIVDFGALGGPNRGLLEVSTTVFVWLVMDRNLCPWKTFQLRFGLGWLPLTVQMYLGGRGGRRRLRHRRRREGPELSGANNLFRRNSVTGAVEVVARDGRGIALNEESYAN